MVGNLAYSFDKFPIVSLHCNLPCANDPKQILNGQAMLKTIRNVLHSFCISRILNYCRLAVIFQRILTHVQPKNPSSICQMITLHSNSIQQSDKGQMKKYLQQTKAKHFTYHINLKCHNGSE